MAQVSTGDVVNLFKKVYGNINDLQPSDFPLAKEIPFSQKQMVGEAYLEAVILSAECGITAGGTAMEAFDINPAIAGAVKQTTVTPSMSVLGSVVPWGVLSRATGEGERSFYDATKFIVKNNLKSHGKFLETWRLYGQATELLGYVSYATATYRGVSLTTGTGTVGGVAFTNGVNTSSKAILMAPGSFAAGHWVGMEGVVVDQIASTGIVASGKLVGVDAEYGILYVDFTPVAASSTTSHKIGYQGMYEAKEMMGAKKILTTSTGNLFGVSTTQYSLWKGVNVALSNVLFTFNRLSSGVALAVNRGGLDGDLLVYVNPRTWSTMINTEAGRRVYDKSYTPTEAENGAEEIKFHTEAGTARIRSHRHVKEGDVFGFHLEDWSRSGSAEISFKVPGVDKEIIFPLENQAAMAFRSFSDQYLFCHAPARSIIWTGVNDESAT